MESDKSPWNSLEIAKILVSVLTPIAIAIFGFTLSSQSANRATERESLERRQAIDLQEAEKNQAIETARYSKVVEKRAALWDNIGPKLNDIYVFSCYVGDWKNLNSNDIIRRKRDIDKTFYTFRPYFSNNFVAAYGNFMKAAFEIAEADGAHAKLRTSYKQRPSIYRSMFADDNRPNIYRTYFDLLSVVGQDLSATTPDTTKSPSGNRPGLPKSMSPTVSYCGAPAKQALIR